MRMISQILSSEEFQISIAKKATAGSSRPGGGFSLADSIIMSDGLQKAFDPL